MPKGKFSLLIVPSENGKIISKEISKRLVVVASLFISCFIVGSLYSAIGFIRSTIDRNKMTGLATENKVLSAKIGDLESTVEMLKADMSKIINKDENIRMVFDLPPLDSDVREVGIGGETFKTPPVNSGLEDRTWMVEEDIEKIHRQIELENASFEGLLGVVEQKKAMLDHTPTIWPCEGFVTRGYGMHNDPFTGNYQPHNGMDISAPRGTPVRAPAAGIVIGASYQAGLGNKISIDHGNGIITTYGHLSTIKVAMGQRVNRGDIIGLVGSTGYSTGPHLHYEVHDHDRAVNPANYIVKSILAIS